MNSGDNRNKLTQDIIDAIAANPTFFTGSCGVVNNDGTVNVRRENGTSVNAIAANITRSGDCAVFKVQGEYYAFSTVVNKVENEAIVVNRRSKRTDSYQVLLGYVYQILFSQEQIDKYALELNIAYTFGLMYDLAFFKQLSRTQKLTSSNLTVVKQKDVPIRGSNPVATTNVNIFGIAVGNQDTPFDSLVSRTQITYNSIVGSKIEKNVFHIFKGRYYFDDFFSGVSLLNPVFDYFKINLNSKKILETVHFSENAVQRLEKASLVLLNSYRLDPFFQIIKYRNSQGIIKLVCFGGCIRGNVAIFWDMGTPETWFMPNNPASYSIIALSSGGTGHRFVYGAIGGIVVTLTSSGTYGGLGIEDAPPVLIGGYSVPVKVGDSQIFIPESDLIGTSGKLATGVIGELVSFESGFLNNNFIDADGISAHQELAGGIIPPPLDTRAITLFKPTVANGQVNPNLFYPIFLHDSGKQIFT